MKGFADRLKAARAVTDLTQEAVADLLEIHRFTYSKWEQGLHPPGKDLLYEKLGKVLDCSVTWLRDGVGDGPGHYTPAPDSVSRRAVIRTRRIHKHLAPGGENGEAGGIDWALVVYCLRQIGMVETKPRDDDHLARTLGLLYGIAHRSPASCDPAMAAQILQAVV